jgi:hypothetical protein
LGTERRPALPVAVEKSTPTFKLSFSALMRVGIVAPLPEYGRMPWFAREFSPGQGHLTSLGPGRDQFVKEIAEVHRRRLMMRKQLGRDVLSNVIKM